MDLWERKVGKSYIEIHSPPSPKWLGKQQCEEFWLMGITESLGPAV